MLTKKTSVFLTCDEGIVGVAYLHEVDLVSVNPPLPPLAGQRQGEVEELRGAGGGARHQHLAVPGETHGAQLEAVEVDLLLDPRPYFRD